MASRHAIIRRNIVFLLCRVRFFVNAPGEIAPASVAQNPFG